MPISEELPRLTKFLRDALEPRVTGSLLHRAVPLADEAGHVVVLRERLCEKGGKRHEMPCHHALEAYVHAYIGGTEIGCVPKGPLFRTVRRGTGQLSETPLPQANAHAMVAVSRNSCSDSHDVVRAEDEAMDVEALHGGWSHTYLGARPFPLINFRRRFFKIGSLGHLHTIVLNERSLR